jgi:hypothetical protein
MIHLKKIYFFLLSTNNPYADANRRWCFDNYIWREMKLSTHRIAVLNWIYILSKEKYLFEGPQVCGKVLPHLLLYLISTGVHGKHKTLQEAMLLCPKIQPKVSVCYAQQATTAKKCELIRWWMGCWMLMDLKTSIPSSIIPVRHGEIGQRMNYQRRNKL